jgi:hypothetical protein
MSRRNTTPPGRWEFGSPGRPNAPARHGATWRHDPMGSPGRRSPVMWCGPTTPATRTRHAPCGRDARSPADHRTVRPRAARPTCHPEAATARRAADPRRQSWHGRTRHRIWPRPVTERRRPRRGDGRAAEPHHKAAAKYRAPSCGHARATSCRAARWRVARWVRRRAGASRRRSTPRRDNGPGASGHRASGTHDGGLATAASRRRPRSDGASRRRPATTPVIGP